MSLSSVEEAISAIRRGEPVVVLDDATRENEGDLIIAAEKVTPKALAFFIRHTSGVVCVSLTPERLAELRLPLMVAENDEAHKTAFTVTVDLKRGVGTGISAGDRSATIRALADPRAQAGDFARPGHVFPLRAEVGGVLRRRGHTEAASDLARLAGLRPYGVLAEIVNDDGTMARPRQLLAFAQRHDLRAISIADLVEHRLRHDVLVEHVVTARTPSAFGPFRAHVFRSMLDGTEHVAFERGDVRGKRDVLVRIHSECLTGDVLQSLRCDCGAQLEASLRAIERAGEGLFVYLRGHEGRGIGLADKLRAYNLQDDGRDTVEANLDLGLPIDARGFDVGARILDWFGLRSVRLLSNNPAKRRSLESHGLHVERVPLVVTPTTESVRYLRSKRDKLGHELSLLSHVDGVTPSHENGRVLDFAALQAVDPQAVPAGKQSR